MLKATIDSSLLNSATKGNFKPELTILFTGLYWKDTIPEEWQQHVDKTHVQNVLYPWNWDLPQVLRIYWLKRKKESDPYLPIKNAAGKPAFVDIVFTAPVLSNEYTADGKKLQTDYYQKILDKGIGLNENNVDPNQICWNGTQTGNLKIDDRYEILKTTETSFLKISISQFAQKISPLNQMLQLVFFSGDQQEITIPTVGDQEKIYFAAFPVGGNWWKVDDTASCVIRDDGFCDLKYIPNELANLKKHKTFEVSSTITELSATNKPQEGLPITLRDADGNFTGIVKIAASDQEDWTNGLQSRLGVYFDLPKLFFNYIAKNKTSVDKVEFAYKLPPGSTPDFVSKYKSCLVKIDEYLWCVLRDTLGLGFQKTANKSSIAIEVALQYCGYDDYYKYNEAEILKFWERYDALLKTLEKNLASVDIKFKSLQEWRNNALQNKFYNSVDQKTRDVISKLQVFNTIKQGKDGLFEKLEPNLITDTTDSINENIDTWINAWKEFFILIENTALQIGIIKAQWGYLADTGYDKNKLLNSLEKILQKTGNTKAVFTETIQCYYANEIIGDDLSIEQAEKSILAGIKKIVQQFSLSRIQKDKTTFNPVIKSDPFADLNIPDLSYTKFLEFIETTFIEQIETPDDKIETTVAPYRKRLFPHRDFLFPNQHKTFLNPPAIRLTVDNIGAQKEDDKVGDDLNDEIAGHIVLMRRNMTKGKDDFESNDWRYLNRAKINFGDNTDLSEKYIIPQLTPVSDGIKKPYITLTNEKLSIISGHDTFTDEQSQNIAANSERLIHKFDDKKTNAYAFWYGHKYQFAGYVALNSGVLPKALRAGNWNIPKNDFKEVNTVEPACTYSHLRRVPVSKIRVIEFKKVLPPPQGLLPLAFELPEWKGIEQKEQEKEEEQIHYLLADDKNYLQTEITLQLKKPVTPFWNWFAWLGEKTNDIEGDKSLVKRALIKEIEARDSMSEKDKVQNILCDPAVENIFVVTIDKLFPKVESNFISYPFMSGGNVLEDIGKELTIIYNETETKEVTEDIEFIELDSAGKPQPVKYKFLKAVKVKSGDVIRIKVHTLIKDNAFKAETQKFYDWMKDVLNTKEKINVKLPVTYSDCIFTNPTELWFEAAIPLTGQFSEKELWDSIKTGQTANKVYCAIEKNNVNCMKLAYASRIETKHQVWDWNGRLDNSEALLEEEGDSGKFKLIVPLDPENGKTTTAMKWEAWAFSDRPDDAGLKEEKNLLASRFDQGQQQVSQILFTDERPYEEKALYYRFTTIAYSRYEKLGIKYQTPVEAKTYVQDDKISVPNVWKRYLRKCSKTKQLPKPALRFAIPLTHSIKERTGENKPDHTKIQTASILIVSNDRHFTEAGLAELVEVGIDIVKKPKQEETEAEEHYLQAGEDPILSGEAMRQVNPTLIPLPENSTQKKYPYIERNGDHLVAVFKPIGPAGLTFEPKMQTPHVRASSYILNIDNISGLLQTPGNGRTSMNAWAMMQIAIRRTLRPAFCEENFSVDALKSDWTAKEWVQFLPAVDSFIPQTWRDKVKKERQLTIKAPTKGSIEFTAPEDELPVFDSTFEHNMRRYMVITQTVYDLGGQPCESYVATMRCNKVNGSLNKFTFSQNHPAPKDENDLIDFSKIKEGYLRIILVRIDNPDRKDYIEDNRDVWTMLFGDNTTTPKADMNAIQKDPTAALPLVTESVPYKIKK